MIVTLFLAQSARSTSTHLTRGGLELSASLCWCLQGSVSLCTHVNAIYTTYLVNAERAKGIPSAAQIDYNLALAVLAPVNEFADN